LDYATILKTATQIVKDAGKISRDYFQKPIRYDLKGEIDLVTDADRETELFLTEALKREFPQIGIVGEEGSDYAPAGAEYFWYVDPIDGTTSFASHLPQFAVCLGLATLDRHPVLGVIYAPVLEECFTAYEGGGVWLNDAPLRVTETTELKQAVVASDFPYDRFTTDDNNIKQFSAMLLRVRAGRALGSAALSLAYVAAGRLDAYWEIKLNPWDVFCGAVMVREAGGVVTDYAGGTDGLKTQKIRVVSSNGRVHQAVLDVLNGA